jgi:hypothetical protein
MTKAEAIERAKDYRSLGVNALARATDAGWPQISHCWEVALRADDGHYYNEYDDRVCELYQRMT